MIKTFLIFTTIVAFITGFNIFIVNLISEYPYLYIVLFIVNLIAIAASALLIKASDELKGLKKSDDTKNTTEESVSVFIKVLIYTLPIIGLIGLYFISVLNKGNELAIEDANSWVSFILGIAAFTMALVTLWQSEWTYSKIFTALDELKIDTNTIKTQNDITSVFRTDLNLKEKFSEVEGSQDTQPDSRVQKHDDIQQAAKKFPLREGE